MIKQPFCEVLEISSGVITCYSNAIYLDNWAFISLLANLANLSTREKFIDRNVIVMWSAYFLAYLLLLSTDIISVKGANIGGPYIAGIYAGSTNIASPYTEGL